MTRIGRLVVTVLLLLAGGSSEAQRFCVPQPTGVDPVNGNFTPTEWVEGDLIWVNNAVGSYLNGAWANTDFDMWFVGGAGQAQLPVAVHFDGFSLQPSQLRGSGQLHGVWGSASNDVWAVGTNGLIEHWDGAQWLTVPSPTRHNLYAVVGTASDDVWAAGNQAMLHWDGTAWTNSPGFVPGSDFIPGTGLAVLSASDVLVAMRRGLSTLGWQLVAWDRLWGSGGSWDLCGKPRRYLGGRLHPPDPVPEHQLPRALGWLELDLYRRPRPRLVEHWRNRTE